MDLKIKIFDIVAAARTGKKTVNEATESILDLFNVLGQGEQLEDFVNYLQKNYSVLLDQYTEAIVQKYKSSN